MINTSTFSRQTPQTNHFHYSDNISGATLALSLYTLYMCLSGKCGAMCSEYISTRVYVCSINTKKANAEVGGGVVLCVKAAWGNIMKCGVLVRLLWGPGGNPH